jgi:hypothetical protein
MVPIIDRVVRHAGLHRLLSFNRRTAGRSVTVMRFGNRRLDFVERLAELSSHRLRAKGLEWRQHLTVIPENVVASAVGAKPLPERLTLGPGVAEDCPQVVKLVGSRHSKRSRGRDAQVVARP